MAKDCARLWGLFLRNLTFPTLNAPFSEHMLYDTLVPRNSFSSSSVSGTLLFLGTLDVGLHTGDLMLPVFVLYISCASPEPDRCLVAWLKWAVASPTDWRWPGELSKPATQESLTLGRFICGGVRYSIDDVRPWICKGSNASPTLLNEFFRMFSSSSPSFSGSRIRRSSLFLFC